jgi:phosphopantothenoylcysteine decarboxylase/phosphopantothenate--cysteine ligase
MSILSGKKIVLGVSGGIAAYKAAELIRLFKKADCEVNVIMTDAAKEFIQPLTFQSLSGNTVYDKMFDQDMELHIGHISLARWADLIVIAPATANIIGKLANGIADDLLSTVCMAFKGNIAIAPAMNEAMWESKAVQKNIAELKSWGWYIPGPAEGDQACGETGWGRMIEPSEIISHVERIFSPQIFTGANIMVTAGPTREIIDPARFISNESSGKMGYAIAEAACKWGAKTILVSGPTALPEPIGVNVIKITSAEEMYKAVMKNIKNIDIFISAAAVADYKPEKFSVQKIKRNSEVFELKLVKTPDILGSVAFLKKPPFIVGFSAETENLLKNASKKLTDKKIDMIAANLVGGGKGFGSEQNELVVIFKDGKSKKLSLKNKTLLAYELLSCISQQYKSFRN